ncbi:uncharacterized protein LOC143178698 [Calliopsis andreniformis]|uniref:uncharacterized protein LOC143178698 n=1 Tax=Calliopsis andreniformis TaxID=337506 RepID=UPI003FCD1D62
MRPSRPTLELARRLVGDSPRRSSFALFINVRVNYAPIDSSWLRSIFYNHHHAETTLPWVCPLHLGDWYRVVARCAQVQMWRKTGLRASEGLERETERAAPANVSGARMSSRVTRNVATGSSDRERKRERERA